MSLFAQKVYDVVVAIPQGKVMSYGAVARQAGSPRAARAVGSLMHKNPDLTRVPCHRVVRSDGTVGDYVFGTKQKTKKLEAEGVEIKKRKVAKKHIITK